MNTASSFPFRRSWHFHGSYAAVLPLLAAWVSAPAWAQSGVPGIEALQVKMEFESGFLMNGRDQPVDLSRFEVRNVLPAGEHSVDVLVNDGRIGRMNIRFESHEGNEETEAVFSRDDVMQLGLSLARLAPEVLARLNEGQRLRIQDVVEQAASSFDFGVQRLSLSVPQYAMDRRARGYVGPDQWDEGVTAAMLGYDVSMYRYGSSRFLRSGRGDGDGGDGGHGGGDARGGVANTHVYAGIQAGINAGGWRLRHKGSYQHDTTLGSKYQGLQTYAQHDLTDWRAQLTLGQSFTPGELFDTVGVTGVQVQSDDRMLPLSMRGFAPTVRGVANTNARVTVRQNGNVLRESVVPPGAFVIDDLYPTGFGGDLEVTVSEADGRVTRFVVPFSSVPLSLRPGVNRFHGVVGQLRDSRVHGRPSFAQGSWQRGFTNQWTGYAGLAMASGYSAVLLGSVLNTSLGAWGVDVTPARTTSPWGESHFGAQWRATYNRIIREYGTSLNVLALRNSSSHYFNLLSAMRLREHGISDAFERPRTRVQVTWSQQLGDQGGQMYLSGFTEDYFTQRGSQLSYSAGYSRSFGKLMLSLSAMRQRGNSGRMGTQYFVGLSIPLGDTTHSNLSTSLAHEDNGRSSLQATLSGSTGVEDALTYAVTAGHSMGMGDVSGDSTTGSASLAYRTSVANLSASTGAGRGYSQASAGIQGSVVVHPEGVTLGQPMSDTIGIVEARDAAGARVVNAAGVRLNEQGYAVLPFMMPYVMNTVELNPQGLSTDVELRSTSQQVAPRAGAVAMLRYATVSGRTALIRITQPDGHAAPFGAAVVDSTGHELGIVGQAGRVVVRGLEEAGELWVRWGVSPADQCRFDYALQARKAGMVSKAFEQFDVACEPATPPALPTPDHSNSAPEGAHR